jgi:hypothetical protein
MRVLLMLIGTATASADPKPDPKPEKVKVVPHVKGMSEAQRGVELTPSIEYENDATKTPAFGGGTALGMVQRPSWHNDMRPYSDGGMVIRPPQTNDDMVILPGTDWLPGRSRLRGLWNALQYGIDRGLEKLIPSGGGT